MKTTFKLLSFILLLTVFVSCGPSKEEKMLEGTWVGQQNELDEDGDELIYNITLKFNYEKEQADVITDITYPEFGKIATIEMHGDWMADEEEITFFLDDDQTSVSYTENLRRLAEMMGVSLSAYEEMMNSMLVNETGIMESMKIYSLTPTTLTVDFDGKLTLHKQ